MQKKPTRFYVYRSKEREGPFTEEQMIELLRRHELKSNHFVWWEGQSDWCQCKKVIWPFAIPSSESSSLLLPPSALPSFNAPPLFLKNNKQNSQDKMTEFPHFKDEFSALLELGALESQDSTAIMDRSQLRVASAEAKRAEQMDRKLMTKKYPQQDRDPVLFAIRFSALTALVTVCAILASSVSGYSPTQNWAKWVGRISYTFVNWFSPIPILNDVTPMEYQNLRKVASDETREKIRFELVLSRETNRASQQPILYFTTNLPDGITYQIDVKSVTGKIIGRFKFEHQADFFPIKNFVRLDLRELFGKDIPQGEYIVSVREAAAQSDLGKRILNELTEAQGGANSIDRSSTLLFRKVLFLGGVQDQDYLQRLSSFQTTLRSRAGEELAQLREILTLLRQAEKISAPSTRTTTGRTPASVNQRWLEEFREKVIGRLQGKSADYLREQFLMGDLFVTILSATVKVREGLGQSEILNAGELFDSEWTTRIQEIESMLNERIRSVQSEDFFRQEDSGR